ncbi:MAG: hypothetical protein HQK53_03540 [Oligoflexia bacterium]|nr:hypothetical protein [Oligoflexia bacterium]
MKKYTFFLQVLGFLLGILIGTVLVLGALGVNGCKRSEVDSSQQIKFFEATNFSEWITTYKVNILNPLLINVDKKFSAGVVRSWQPLLKLETLVNERESRSYCIIYRFPAYNGDVTGKKDLKNNDLGELKVVAVTSNDDCDKHLYSKSNNHISGITVLNIWLTDYEQKRFLEKELKPFHLYIMGEVIAQSSKKGMPFALAFPLQNMKKGNVLNLPLSAYPREKFFPSVPRKLLSGVTFLQLELELESQLRPRQ